MADEEIQDKRRRRRNSTETCSESEQGDPDTSVNDEENSSTPVESPDVTIPDTSGSVAEDTEADNSEYESAEEDQDDATGTEVSEEETETVDDQTYDETTDDDVDSRLDDSVCDSELVEEERQSGDGQEQPDELKDELDDDEDAKNPAYIPRRGAFYEHDNRGAGEDSKEAEARPKRPLWKEEGKWLHDLYKTELQAPRSREELIALYGYDITTRDRPPDEPPRYMRRGRGRRGGVNSRNQLSDFMPEDRDRGIDRGAPRGGHRGGARGGPGRPQGPQGPQDFHVREEEFPRLPNQTPRQDKDVTPTRTITNTRNLGPDKAPPPRVDPPPQRTQYPAPQSRPQPRSEPPRQNKGKQFTNTSYRNTQNQMHNESPRGAPSQVESGPPPQAQVPARERRSNRALRGGRNSAERSLPDRMADMNISDAARRQPEPALPKATVAPTISREQRTLPQPEPVSPQPRPSEPPRPTAAMQGAGDAANFVRSQQKEQQRPKRYSTQRQRPVQDQPPQQYAPEHGAGPYYPPGFSAAPMYQPSSREVTYSTTVYNGQAVPYQVPTGAAGMPSPPRLFPQTNVSMATLPPTGPPPGLMAAPFPPPGAQGPPGVPPVPAGVYATGPPPAFPPMVGQMAVQQGQMAVQQGQMAVPQGQMAVQQGQMAVQQVQQGMMQQGMPVQVQVSAASAQNQQQQNLQEMYHGGTTYYAPQHQHQHQHQHQPVHPPQPPQQQWAQQRSKKAIPIVRPQDMTSHRQAEMDHAHVVQDDRERTPTNE